MTSVVMKLAIILNTVSMSHANHAITSYTRHLLNQTKLTFTSVQQEINHGYVPLRMLVCMCGGV